ncbi:hypothetical protein IMSAGC019_03814 [Lachnospiraceae bacterium]|nr:hypothetical protein IMSAGC019_03814 [Lachnospiraceae bacterium]
MAVLPLGFPSPYIPAGGIPAAAPLPFPKPIQQDILLAVLRAIFRHIGTDILKQQIFLRVIPCPHIPYRTPAMAAAPIQIFPVLCFLSIKILPSIAHCTHPVHKIICLHQPEGFLVHIFPLGRGNSLGYNLQVNYTFHGFLLVWPRRLSRQEISP